MSAQGFVVLDPELVAKACEKFFDKRDARINEEREEMIAREMARKRFFRRKFTREEAIAFLKNNRGLMGTYWDEPRNTGWFQYSDLVDVYSLCKTAIKNQAPITIDLRTNSWLEDYLQEEK